MLKSVAEYAYIDCIFKRVLIGEHKHAGAHDKQDKKQDHFCYKIRLRNIYEFFMQFFHKYDAYMIYYYTNTYSSDNFRPEKRFSRCFSGKDDPTENNK